MKKALFVISVMLMALLPLPAMIHFPGEMSYDDKAWLIDVFHSAYMGRDDAEIAVESLTEEDGIVTLSFMMEDEERVIKAPDRETLKHFVARALYQEEELFLSEDALFFVDDGIIASHTDFRPGRLIEAYDREDNVRGLMMSRKSPEGVNLFTPWFEQDLMPGLSLRQGPVCSIDLGVSTSFRQGEVSAFISARSLIGLQNMFFKGGFRFTLADSRGGYHGSLGVESRASLSMLFDSSFTLVEDAAVFASAELLLGWMDGFSVGGVYQVGYEHYPIPSIYWRLGAEFSSLTKYHPALVLSGGVLL